MNTEIMVNWLRNLDKAMQERGQKAVLIIDNFATHAAAVQLIKASKKLLKNTKVY